ncbi:MAG: hypothetical protein D6736_13415 [Nitrospinota bacterium]|nr:MAG: hypothetical protein D6736_13415 [Nitrospinota bacterium]
MWRVSGGCFWKGRAMLRGKGVLTPIQQAALTLFATLPDQERFYLTGGTALAEFFLGHRLSFDLDLFTTEEVLIVPFSRSLEKAYLDRGWEVDVIRRFTSYVEILLRTEEDELRLDLALDSPFRFTSPLHSEYGVWVNDYDDLQAEKVLAYYGRAEPRDAVDLYFLLQEETPEHLMALAAQKDSGFDRYWFAVTLNRAQQFPDDLKRWPVKMLKSFEPDRLKAMFQNLALQIMEEIAGGQSHA